MNEAYTSYWVSLVVIVVLWLLYAVLEATDDWICRHVHHDDCGCGR